MSQSPEKDAMPIVHQGDCLEVMRSIPDGSIDAIVTDPPYGLGFMGKAWDYLPPSREWAAECLRVLKPGGHLLAFGGTRTWHRLAVAVEDAGFEMRDSIAWLYGSGFPKSLNLVDEDGERTGWGTALKPAHEPIVVARKPLTGTVAANVAEYGTGALNIDGCRIGDEVITQHGRSASENTCMENANRAEPAGRAWSGRWPANVVFDEERAAELGEASRFFYVAKARKDERPVVNGVTHPTVKPLALMRWLVRLVTPPGGTILEPFAGSGTTVEAAMVEGFSIIAIEREATYLPLIGARIARHRKVEAAPREASLFDEPPSGPNVVCPHDPLCRRLDNGWPACADVVTRPGVSEGGGGRG